MTFGLTGTKVGNGGNRVELTLCDTEEEARNQAERLLRSGNWMDIAIWKQIAVPFLKQSVEWAEKQE